MSSSTWKAAVLAALHRYSKRYRSLQIERASFLREELAAVVRQTGTAGRTPAQTVSRILQELRDEGTLYFSSVGVYVLDGVLIDAASEDFPDDLLEHAAQAGNLVLADVPASNSVAMSRVRRGAAALRRATLLNYEGCCSVCDVRDAGLLVASHIARWADRPQARGHLDNVICLCRLHDPLFETGYFALSDKLAVVWRENLASSTISLVASHGTGPFRLPKHRAPAVDYLLEHRSRVGL